MVHPVIKDDQPGKGISFEVNYSQRKSGVAYYFFTANSGGHIPILVTWLSLFWKDKNRLLAQLRMYVQMDKRTTDTDFSTTQPLNSSLEVKPKIRIDALSYFCQPKL